MPDGSHPHTAERLAELYARLEKAEVRAAEAEEAFALAFDHSPIAMAIISAVDNRYIRINHALEVLSGRTREQISSVDPFTFALTTTHVDDLAADQVLFGELALGKRTSYTLDKRYLRPDGSARRTRMTMAGAYDGKVTADVERGTLRYIVVQMMDITREVELAEALERREQELRHAQRVDGLGRLVGGIAHDFNNLLTVITGHGEILRGLANEGAVTASELADNLDAILAAAERAAAMTAQLLAHGRREPVLPRTFALSDAVASMQRLLVRVIGSNIEVDHQLHAAGFIHADQGQIGQVVMNLVLNARDAMPNGGRLTLVTRDVSDETIALEVTDTGHGMSPEVQARMFEPFFTTRADRPGAQGNGLGLATVQRVVHEQGGHIAVASQVGRGTTVTVRLPRAAAVTAVERALPNVLDASRGERVLVVEDDPAVRALVASVLVGGHYRVSVARNGEEALARLDEVGPFELVITDLMMARIGGLALAERLRERGHPMKMLFISGYSDTTPVELMPYGTLLPKPFTPAQLLAAVQAALSN